MGMTQSAFDPPSRFRFIQYVPFLEGAGWAVTLRHNRPDRKWTSPLRNRLARGVHFRAGRAVMKANRLRDIRDARAYDVVFVSKDLAGGNGPSFEERLLRTNPRVVFDFDDALFVGPKAEPIARRMCERSAWVTPGNDYLAEYASRHTTRVTVIPTVINTESVVARSWDGADPDATVRIGWSGSDASIRTTLFPYLEMLAAAQREVPFELVVITNTRPTLPVPGLRWTFHPWTPEGEETLWSKMDVGIMPLVDDEFQRGKCGLKLLQYMAAGLPTIASPVGVNREITREGETGFLADSPAQWREALLALTRSHELRASMGQAGRKRCEQSYSIRRWLPTLLDIFERVGAARPATTPS
jgi:hypothetical protein